MWKLLFYKFNKYSTQYEYLIKIIIIITTFFVWFLLDFLTKYFLFTFDVTKQNIGVSYGIIGVRSYPHANTTLISFLKLSINPQFIGIFAIFMSLILIIMAIKVKRKLISFWLMMIIAGILGNGIDFLRFGYVLDIIYIPWFDRGTFNLADVLIVVGIIGLAITIFINEVIRERKYESII